MNGSICPFAILLLPLGCSPIRTSHPEFPAPPLPACQVPFNLPDSAMTSHSSRWPPWPSRLGSVSCAHPPYLLHHPLPRSPRSVGNNAIFGLCLSPPEWKLFKRGQGLYCCHLKVPGLLVYTQKIPSKCLLNGYVPL